MSNNLIFLIDIVCNFVYSQDHGLAEIGLKQSNSEGNTMIYQTLSARLRTDIKADLGATVLNAIQDHLYHKALDYFDPAAHWDVTEVLELSELAHRLRDFASGLDTTNPMKIEAMRVAKTIWNDFAAVYKIAMKRTTGTMMLAA